MNTTKILTAAEIIKNTAVEFLANKHSITVDQVVEAIKSGDVRANEQFKSLVMAAIEQAATLEREGQISFA